MSSDSDSDSSNDEYETLENEDHLLRTLTSVTTSPVPSPPPISNAKASISEIPTPAPRKIKEINVLILGETGVGKSTWINSILNYMAYRTVDEALTGPEICPIPCRLKIVDENYKTKDIQVGGYSNHEVMTTGQSSTQITVPYVTTWFDENGVQYLVRLVDTPGIGDVRGPDFDKKHIANIVDHMAFVQEIHGICILLQPNNARLNLIFQYCLNELLSHLHRDASKNIAFVFTNARGSNYKPGNTMHILRQFLSNIEDKQGVSIPTTKENMFFLDNEAFPYLCKARRKVEFDEIEKEVYKQSWDFSRKENDRLFTFITTRPPHNIADTVTLNEARRLILSLAKPLADISSNIQTNIKVIENHMKLIIDCGKKVQDLTSQKDATSSNTQFTFTIVKLEASPLGYPRTVCTSETCVEKKTIFNTDEMDTLYKQHCHPHCYLDDVIPNRIPDPGLHECAAMDDSEEFCTQCGCSWDRHMHITYDQVQKSVQIDNAEIDRLIKQNADKKTLSEASIREANKVIKEFELEQEVIKKTCIKFGLFLKKHAILPYNDTFEAYVDHAIKEEERQGKPNNTKLERLRRMIAEYREERDILENSMKSSGEVFTPDQIGEMYAELIALPHKGQEIEQILVIALQAQERILHHKDKYVTSSLPALPNTPFNPNYSCGTSASTSSNPNNGKASNLRQLLDSLKVK